METIKLGISACLTGEEVRFDRGHKRSPFAMDQLGKFVQYQAFCPEVAIGLPIPRPTIRQVRDEDIIKVCRPDGTGDVTDALREYGKSVAQKSGHLSGFIVCAKSPSCGMERVKVYAPDGKGSEANGVGAFTEQIMKHNPLLPVEENGRLNDPIIKENFVMRIFVYKKWQKLVESGLTQHKLFEFHSQNKYLLMAHNQEFYKTLGRQLAESDLPVQETADQYILGLMTALKHKATRKTHSNTLLHIAGYFKKDLSKQQKEELIEQIESYRTGLLPLLAPLTLFKHYLREFPKAYLQQQSYFEPYPMELRLRYGY
jgi:uncharacterized protein YbgA (DUF1722 family)/uncharacterized protein YbbK (DUF523 family)